jgi:hypothetical protein
VQTFERYVFICRAVLATEIADVVSSVSSKANACVDQTSVKETYYRGKRDL